MWGTGKGEQWVRRGEQGRGRRGKRVRGGERGEGTQERRAGVDMPDGATKGGAWGGNHHGEVGEGEHGLWSRYEFEWNRI